MGHIFFEQEFRDLPVDTFQTMVLHQEVDLIELPYVKSIEVVHTLSLNFSVVRLKAKAPLLPGFDDIHARIGFDLWNEPEACMLFFYWSPPEGAADFHGWIVPPADRGCMRGRIDGMSVILRRSTKPGCCNVSVIGQGKLPVPRSLIPNWVIKLVVRSIINFALPRVSDIGKDFHGSPFASRVCTDSAGFYAAL